MELKWHEKPLRIVEFIREWGVASSTHDSKSEAEALAGMHANAQHFHAMGYDCGFTPHEINFETSVRTCELPDFLTDHIKAAREAGIRVIVYFNVHHGNESCIEWAQYGSDGKPIVMLYGAGWGFCVNSSFRQVATKLAEDVGKYDIDGLFMDGPIFLEHGCFCPFCTEFFLKRYGYEMPKEPSADAQIFADWLEFRENSLAEFIRDVRSALKASNPDAIIYANANGLVPQRSTGCNNRKWIEHMDVLGAEGGFIFYVQPSEIPIWKPAATAKLLETQAGGKPRIVFLCGAHKPWDRYILTGAETELLFAHTAAHNANPWYAVLRSNLGTDGVKSASRMLEKLEGLESALSETRSAAEVAMLWSAATEDFYGTSVDYTDFTAESKQKDVHGRSQESFSGCYEALVRSHVPFDLIDDAALTDGTLSRYKMIVLPNTACVSDKATDALRGFVKGGGCLLSTFAATLYDELGKPRKDFALADVFGVSYTGDIIDPAKYDYITATEEGSNILGTMQEVLPAPPSALAVRPSSAQILLRMHEHLESRYRPMPAPIEFPAMTVNEYGKGKAYYVAGNVGEFFWTHRLPEHFRWLTAPVKKEVPQLVELLDAPQTIDLTLRRKGTDQLLIHLINFSGNMQRPITEIAPVTGLILQVRVPRVRSATALIARKDLRCETTEDGVKIRLPRLDTYEVLLCELECI